jgi:hypothetical protein
MDNKPYELPQNKRYNKSSKQIGVKIQVSDSSKDRFIPPNGVDHFRSNERSDDLYPEIIIADLGFMNWLLDHFIAIKDK